MSESCATPDPCRLHTIYVTQHPDGRSYHGVHRDPQGLYWLARIGPEREFIGIPRKLSVREAFRELMLAKRRQQAGADWYNDFEHELLESLEGELLAA